MTVMAVLKTIMSARSSKSHLKLLSMEYRSLPVDDGLKYVLGRSESIALKHVVLVVRPTGLRSRLKRGVTLSYAIIKTDFNCYLVHVVIIFEIVKKVV